MGNDARMLDILHLSNTAIIRGPCTWDGGSRFLEGGINAENNLGEIYFLEASADFG